MVTHAAAQTVKAETAEEFIEVGRPAKDAFVAVHSNWAQLAAPWHPSLSRPGGTATTHTHRHPLLQVDLPKPLGLKFARGNDGGAYVVQNDPKLGNTDPRIQVGGWHLLMPLRWAGADALTQHQRQQQ